MSQNPPENVVEVASHDLLLLALQPFREIAAECTEEECLGIMEDCLESDSPVMRGHVRDLYAKRLESLRKMEVEVAHYEAIYD